MFVCSLLDALDVTSFFPLFSLDPDLFCSPVLCTVAPYSTVGNIPEEILGPYEDNSLLM